MRTMFKCSLVALLGALSLGSLTLGQTKAKKAQPTSKPNIIFFLVDDMGWQDTSVPMWRDKQGKPQRTFLNDRYKTPNMECLAQQGMVFSNAYAQPVCSPSRVSLLTGMNAARHHVTNWTLKRDVSTDAGHNVVEAPKDWAVNGIQPEHTKASGETTVPLTERKISYEMKKPYMTATPFPELMKKLGYTTIHCGKAHFGTKDTPGANPKNFGFDYNIAGTEIGGPGDYRGSKKYGSGDFHVCGLDENNYYTDDVFLTEALTQEALKRLEAIRQSPTESKKPFYLYMAHYAIHAPFNERGYDKRFADNYKNPNDGKPWSDNEKRYSGLIEGMDKSLGDIMAYLKKTGLDKNTVIIFMSDNGGLAISGRMGNETTNYPLTYGKGSGNEGGIREPMMVVWPGVVKAGSYSEAPVIIEDFFPTMLQMAGAKKLNTEQVIDGKSIVAALKGKKMDYNRPLLFHCPNIWGEGHGNNRNYNPFTAMRQGDWKLVYWHPDQRLELYNLADDISEKHNLAQQEPKRLLTMAQEMTKLLKDRKAQMPTYKKDNKVGAQAGDQVPMPDVVAQKMVKK